MRLKSVQLSTCIILILSLCACGKINLYKKAEVDRTFRINVLEYCPLNGRSLVNIFATNLSAIVSESEYLKDTDRDGLSDNFEKTAELQLKYNISYNNKDTDGNGYSDLIGYVLGMDREQQETFADCPDFERDTDGDLLTDCEEAALGLDPFDPDTDKDGIPDGLEVRYGLNAKDPLDAGSDLDGDGISNLEEIRSNSLVDYHYELQTLKHRVNYQINAFLNADNQECYELLVSNLPVVEVSNGNMLKVMFLEMENVQGQGQVNHLRHVTIVASRGLGNGHMVVVDRVSNQTILETGN